MTGEERALMLELLGCATRYADTLRELARSSDLLAQGKLSAEEQRTRATIAQAEKLLSGAHANA